MAEQNLKEPQMHLHKNHYFELPKATIIAFMGVITMAVFGGIIGYFVQITQLEKDIEAIYLRLERQEVSVMSYKSEFATIQRQLDRIEHSLSMKQDRKFIE